VIRVGIFGSSGYLGNAVIEVLKLHEICFVPLPRGVDEIREEELATITHVIDCAFPKNYMDATVYELYTSEVRNRISQFKANGQRYLYLGSFSSVNGGYSEYGKCKRRVEEVVTQSGFEVLRIGLVLELTNLGGRALEFQNTLDRLPIIPLPHKSWFPLYVTSLQTFKDSILKFITEGSVEGLCVAKLSTLSSITSQLTLGKRQIEIPSWLTLIIVFFIRITPLKKLDSLRSISTRFPLEKG
jgi:hypothetical protein